MRRRRSHSSRNKKRFQVCYHSQAVLSRQRLIWKPFFSTLSSGTESTPLGECTEMQLLHGAAKYATARRLSTPKRKKERCGKERRRPSWEAGPVLVRFLASAERRAVAASYCGHCEAGRNVWPALWETAPRGPQLSQPRDSNPARVQR